MTTYIKKVTMYPVTTQEEHEEMFVNELDLIDDMLDALKDITTTIDGKDDNGIMSEEIEELEQLRMDLRDSMVNINKIVKSHIKILEENKDE